MSQIDVPKDWPIRSLPNLIGLVLLAENLSGSGSLSRVHAHNVFSDFFSKKCLLTMMDEDASGTGSGLVPNCPVSWLNLPGSSVKVEDPDEEESLQICRSLLQTGSLLDPSLFEQIFHLYSRLAESSKDANESGLGFVDPASPLITVRLHVPDESAAEKKARGKGKSKGRHGVSYAEDKKWMKEEKVLEWEIEQDIAGLKGRKGDTGAVLWRASIHLARLILSSPHRSPLSSPLFDPTVFIRSNLRVLELGAGTGFLSVALHSSLCGKEGGEWTVTDQKSLLTLIGRNLEMNGVHHEFGEGENRNEREPTNTRRLPGKNTAQSTRGRVTVQELDWLEVEHTWKEDLHSRLRGRRPPTTSGDSASPYDLILAVDCIFNESLILPFLRTIDHLSTAFAPQDHREQEGTKGDWSGDVNVKGSSGTVVMVVCELRSSEVMREFLGAWVDFQREGAVDHGDQTVRWNIWRVGEEALSPESGDQYPSKVDKGLGNGRYVVWVAWKE